MTHDLTLANLQAQLHELTKAVLELEATVDDLIAAGPPQAVAVRILEGRRVTEKEAASKNNGG